MYCKLGSNTERDSVRFPLIPIPAESRVTTVFQGTAGNGAASLLLQSLKAKRRVITGRPLLRNAAGEVYVGTRCHGGLYEIKINTLREKKIKIVFWKD